MTAPFGQHKPTATKDRGPYGEQQMFTFANGYTASVVRGMHTYGGRSGLWELAVMHGGKVVWDTPVATDDVLGCLTGEQVAEALDQIAALPKRVSRDRS